MISLANLGLTLALSAVPLIWPGMAQAPGGRMASLGGSVVLGWILLAVSIRRMHDLGKTGWFMAFWIVPIVGFVLLAWLFGRPATPGPNRFGSGERPGGAAVAAG